MQTGRLRLGELAPGGIILDIDDTLVNHSQAETEAGARFGRMYSREIPDYSPSLFPGIWRRASQRHMKDFLSGRITFEQQRIGRIRDIFRSPSMTSEEASRIFRSYLTCYEESWRLFSDVLPFLEECRRRAVPLGILSDGSRAQQEKKLEATGIGRFFSFVLTAEDAGTAKPDPRFFRRAAGLLPGTGGKVYYIGDNLAKDARGAEQAGLKGIWLNRRKGEGSFSFTVESLADINVSGLWGG